MKELKLNFRVDVMVRNSEDEAWKGPFYLETIAQAQCPFFVRIMSSACMGYKMARATVAEDYNTAE